jgi:5'-3' exonuclease
VDVHLVDGTAELVRYFYALPRVSNYLDEEIGALRAVNYLIRGLVMDGATHLGIATGPVAGDGVPPELAAQVALMEEGLVAWGLRIWPSLEHASKDVVASAAALLAGDPAVDRVVVCSPDKLMAQCVRGTKVVQYDRARKTVRDEAGVVEKYGVPPGSIPDYLALTGLPGWGAKSTAQVLAKFGRIEAIPDDPAQWSAGGLRAAASLSATLNAERSRAEEDRAKVTLRVDVPVALRSVDELKWLGPTPKLTGLRRRLVPARQRGYGQK